MGQLGAFFSVNGPKVVTRREEDRVMRALIVGAAAMAMSVTGSLSSAQAQSCVDALPAFQSVMKSDQPAELVAYLEAHGPCFDAPVKAKLKALGGPPPVTSSATPEGPAGDASNESAADGDAGAALVIPAPASALRPSDLRLEKRQAGICKAGQACEFEILVYNPSGQDWSGPLFLEESQDANAQSPGWFCSPTGNGESLCLTDRGPRAGETLSLWVELNLSNRALAQAQNCAELKIDGDDRLLFRMLQAGLAARGYEPGPADGLPGRKTKGALSRFAETQGLDLSFDRPELLVATEN